MKKTKNFLPRKSSEMDAWENNFLDKIKDIGAELKIAEEEIVAVTDAIGEHREAFSKMTTIKQDAAKAVAEHVGKSEKAIALLRKFVNTIKNRPLYNDAIGNALDIISGSSDDDDVVAKPVLKLVGEGGIISVRFTKSGFDGVKLFCRRGEEASFSFMGLYLASPFKDSRQNLIEGKPEKREYYAYFFDKEEEVGQASDVAIIVK